MRQVKSRSQSRPPNTRSSSGRQSSRPRPATGPSPALSIRISVVATLKASMSTPATGNATRNPSSVKVSCTATLATDRVKRGDHRVCVATRDEKGTVTYELTLTKGARTRMQEEALASLLLIRALAQACGVKGAPELELVAEEVVRVHKGERGLLPWLSRQSLAWSDPSGSNLASVNEQLRRHHGHSLPEKHHSLHAPI